MNLPSQGFVSLEFAPLIDLVSNIVHRISGNRLGEKQAYMIETRVKKRMMELNFKSAKEYSDYIEKNFEKESHILVGLITTHHTFFFREYPHFEILKLKLPEIVKEVKKRNEKNVLIWSAACSRGHEVYSLAMFLNALLPEIDSSMSFKIIGTDIDNESIKIAQNGVFHQNEIKEREKQVVVVHDQQAAPATPQRKKWSGAAKGAVITSAPNLAQLTICNGPRIDAAKI